MYDSVRLEKGMYHLANHTFAQALEAADPSAQYAGTELAGLDAFERQLKRFDIHVSGENCDPVEKFFTTTESAVLFPEFVRRAIKRGMEESILPELTAAASAVSASSCKGFSVDETDGAYSVTTAEGVSLKKTVITESAAIALDKYGRLISASYETIRQQRIDVFAVMLRAVGHKLAGAIAGKALKKRGKLPELDESEVTIGRYSRRATSTNTAKDPTDSSTNNHDPRGSGCTNA